MGLGGALVALFAALIALTVLPAVLTLLGAAGQRAARRASCSGAPSATRGPTRAGFWYRLSRFVMRRPVPVATLSAALLIVLGHPVPRASSSPPSTPSVLPESASARQVDDALQRDFPPYRDTPIRLASRAAARRRAATVAAEVGAASRASPQCAPPQPPARRRRPRSQAISADARSSPTRARTR